MQRLTRAFPSTSSHTSYVVPFDTDRRPPQNRGKCHNIQVFLWNKEKNTMCNRTLFSWCKILLFYISFILLIFGIFVMNLNLGTNYIKQHYKTPVINKNSITHRLKPGIGFTPNLSRRSSSLIWYTIEKGQRNNNNTNVLKSLDYTAYVKHINKILSSYKNAENNHRNDYVDCSVIHNSTKPCLFSIKNMGPCGSEPYGYLEKRPCVYLTIDKVHNWQPSYYDKDLPNEMPKSLRDVISKETDKKKVWIHCSGHYPYDVEHLGPVSYYPHQGVMGYYFPYTDNENYLQPLVAIKVNNIKKGYLIDIRCYLWAKNINSYDRNHYSTTIRFYMGM